MRETLERELKLEPTAGFTLPELPGEPLEERRFVSTYYDTPARSLTNCGITLRRRVENATSLWQLKLPRDGARAELEVAGDPAHPPEELERLLFAHLRHGALAPVATLATRRVGVRVRRDSDALADVVLDSVDVLGPDSADQQFSEIEIELIDGDQGDLDRLGRLLRRAGARRSAGTAKVMRVLRPTREAPPSRTAPPIEHLRFLLARQLRELETYDPGVRLGADPEDLHRFRVASRRARALVRASRPLLGGRLAELKGELRWLGGVLGPVRDLDVLILDISALVEDLDADRSDGQAIVAALEAERATARVALLEALGSDRYLALLDRFRVEVEALSDREAEGRLTDLAAAEFRRLEQAYGKLGGNPADDELHAVRIRAKRARYAAELAAPTGGKRLASLVEALKQLQDVIGAHQDAVVAEERVRAVAPSGSFVALGRIVERERARRQDARAQAPRAWKRVAREGGKAFA